ncbi:MAG: type I 3-dehydroquinate dehydratase [Mesosutterella sp.]|nr:type I 3-dehydroquinate dehydratase [Mesosutterella sp.]
MSDSEKGLYRVPGKGYVIGAGRPGILVSASGDTPGAILESVSSLSERPEIAGIELRLDRLDRGRNSDEILELADLVNIAWARAGAKLLIVTVRSRGEGGEASFSGPEYERLVGSLARSARADLIDVELCWGEGIVRRLVQAAHLSGAGVIVSRHDFEKTPELEAMLSVLRREASLGADVAKIAVMPKTPEDVARLLLATARARAELPCPLITMAMGALGAVSRVSGEIFGSALTFARIGGGSAPGQLEAGEADAVMRALSLQR